MGQSDFSSKLKMDKLYNFFLASDSRPESGFKAPLKSQTNKTSKNLILVKFSKKHQSSISSPSRSPNRKITRCYVSGILYLPFRSRFSDQRQFESYCPLVLARLAPASATNTTITSSHSPGQQINSTNRTTRILNPGK